MADFNKLNSIFDRNDAIPKRLAEMSEYSAQDKNPNISERDKLFRVLTARESEYIDEVRRKITVELTQIAEVNEKVKKEDKKLLIEAKIYFLKNSKYERVRFFKRKLNA